MNDLKLRLKDFFIGEDVVLSEKSLSDAEPSQAMVALKEKIEKEVKGVEWPLVKKGLSEKIVDLLDVPISDIMVKTWNEYRVLEKYRDKESHPPDEVNFVPLVDHDIESRHTPCIEVLINEQPIKRISFDVVMTLTLKGMILKIQDGKIKSITIGACEGKGSVYCEGFEILKRESRTVSLPGTIDLGDGIPIAP